MRIVFMVICLPSLAILALSMGCGEDFEKALGKVFVTGSAEEDEKSSGSLSNELVSKLNLDVDDESTVVSNLKELHKKSLNMDNDGEKIAKSLNYVTTIVRRTDLLPKQERSPCQCNYQQSTFLLATEVLGEFLVQMHSQQISTKAKDKPDDYRELYRHFNHGKEVLELLSKVDPVEFTDTTRVEEIQKKASEYLKKLSDQTKKSNDNDIDTEVNSHEKTRGDRS